MGILCVSWVNLNNNEMNRRLEINISSDHEEQHSPEYQDELEPSDDGEEENQREEEEEEEEEEEGEDGEDEPSHYSRPNQHSISHSRQGAFESVETFGNHQPTSTDRHFVDRLLPHRPYPHHSPPSLNETPIGQRPAQRRRINHSEIDDEVARIISKVNRSHHNSGHHEESTHTRIGGINKQLLKENTDLIGQINQLESKLEGLCGKNTKRSKDSAAEALAVRLQKYKEKLGRAMALNSKLSSGLATEKSRSHAISSTFPSMLNANSHSQISTLRSHIRADSNSLVRSKKQAICARCCKDLAEASEKESVSMRSKEAASYKEAPSPLSKELIFSPVLQFKNYEITGEKSSQLEIPRHTTREVHCQVNFEETAALERLRAAQEEERALQATIEANNKRIHEFQELLYQLVDLN